MEIVMNDLTYEDLKKIYDNNKNMTDKPIILYFYEKWNPTSKFFEEVVNKLESEYNNKVNFYRIDASKEYVISSTFNVRGTPFLTFISGGGNVFLNTGVTSEDILKDNIEKMIQSKSTEKEPAVSQETGKLEMVTKKSEEKVISKKSKKRVIPRKVNKQFIQKKIKN
jgi:thioredoxin-like negative regulator of GroEL